MWPVIRWTLWQRRWSIFWWCLGLLGFIFLTLIFYPSIKTQADQLQKTLGNLPSTAIQLFGGTDFFSPIGYLNSQIVYLMLPLLLSVLSIGLGNSLIGREEHEQTIEVLLARPLSRGRLLLAKGLAGIINVLAVTTVGTLATVLLAKAVGLAVPSGNIVAACFACFMLVLTFGGVAFLLSATGRGRAAGLGVAAIFGIGGYIIGSLSGTVHWLKTPGLIFPYHYYRSADILRGQFDWSSILFFAIFVAICGLLSWIAFRARDLA